MLVLNEEALQYMHVCMYDDYTEALYGYALKSHSFLLSLE